MAPRNAERRGSQRVLMAGLCREGAHETRASPGTARGVESPRYGGSAGSRRRRTSPVRSPFLRSLSPSWGTFEKESPMHVSRRSTRSSLRIATALVLVAAVARGNHKDERLGFTIQTPNKWTAIPMSGDERWMVAKHLCDKSYFWEDKKEGWPREHKPDMEVIAFVDAAVKEKAKLVKKEARNGRREWF